MITQLLTTSFFSSDIMYLLFFIAAWAISFFSFPVIINISNEKGLMATPCDRSSHSIQVPNLGGVGIFIGFIVTFTIFGSIFSIGSYYNLIGSLVVLFFLGIQDDILILSAKNKFVFQFIVSLFLTMSSNITINSLYGLFGIHEISLFASIALTTFIYVLIINSYNLIDGIDGLAGTVGICFLAVSSILFYYGHIQVMFVISLILFGSILAFLQYNFSTRKKIFMGDTGSMIVGFLISFLVINLLNINVINFGFFSYKVSPVLLLALLLYPLLDTARIFFVRLFILKKSPFKADKNHIHHRLLILGFRHRTISVFVGVITLSLAAFSVLIEDESLYYQLFSVLILGTFLYSIPLLFKKMKSMNFNSLKSSVLSLLLLAGIMQSCATKKDILYLRDNSKAPIQDIKIKYQKIEPNDILSIKVYSLDPEASKLYNIDLLQTAGTAAATAIINPLTGYLVTDLGEIIMPILGNIQVNDKSTTELEVYLKNKLIDDGQLKDPIVSVRIINSKVTVLGEVSSPGVFTFNEKNMTVFQALGLAGDLTINGERKDVLLIRQDKNVKIVHHLDLTSINFMDTELYYIKPNDVLIINPNTSKIQSSGVIGNVGTFMSIISFLITLTLLIKR